MAGILVVDEHKDMMGLYADVFSNSSYKMFKCYKPKEAKKLVTGNYRNLVSLIIADSYISEINVYEMIRQIYRANEKIKFILHPAPPEKAVKIKKKVKPKDEVKSQLDELVSKGAEIRYLPTMFKKEDLLELVKSMIG